MQESENTFYDAKRLFGKLDDDPLVVQDKAFWPFRVERDDMGSPVFKSKKFGTYYPKDICKKIIEVFRKTAGEYMPSESK